MKEHKSDNARTYSKKNISIILRFSFKLLEERSMSLIAIQLSLTRDVTISTIILFISIRGVKTRPAL